MKRACVAVAFFLTLGALCWSASPVAAQTGKAKNTDMYARCGNACTDCMTACKACVTHCTAMVKAGVKAHEKTLHLSEDCADICATAARLCNRHGPMSVAVCEACAQACDACGAECAKYPDMKPMRDCKVSCQVCGKACRDMIQHLKR